MRHFLIFRGFSQLRLSYEAHGGRVTPPGFTGYL